MNSRILELVKDTCLSAQWKALLPYAQPNGFNGINLPLFSIHTKNSCGIGEYLDLLPLIDWSKSVGFNILQLLPLNDPGEDSSPYNALSAFALNPLHLSLHPLAPNDPALKEGHLLNRFKRVPYPKIRTFKMKWLTHFWKHNKQQILKKTAFQKFQSSQKWLRPYAEFRTLKERYKQISWIHWPKTLPPFTKKEEDQIQFYEWLQFACFEQLSEVKTHASAQSVLLKGDLPILVSPDSADVWKDPHLFDLSLDVGAPPDQYSKSGQHWGFPLYRWDLMQKDDYLWWRERLKYAENFYHAYRLDHIIGFFRLWAIPKGKPATEGFFFPEDFEEQLEQGYTLLKRLTTSSSMLPIGEDLGVIPDEVRQIMQNIGICGTKVMRWERQWKTDLSFIPPKNYAPFSMTTLSIHDSEVLKEWWQTYPKDAKMLCSNRNWKYSNKLSPEIHKTLLKESYSSSSIFHINLLQEVLALLPGLHWENPADDRINTPGTLLKKNWSYKYPTSLETIIQKSEAN